MRASHHNIESDIEIEDNMDENDIVENNDGDENNDNDGDNSDDGDDSESDNMDDSDNYDHYEETGAFKFPKESDFQQFNLEKIDNPGDESYDIYGFKSTFKLTSLHYMSCPKCFNVNSNAVHERFHIQEDNTIICQDCNEKLPIKFDSFYI